MTTIRLMFLYVRIYIRDRNIYLDKKRHPPPVHDASTVEAVLREESGEASKATHDEQTSHRMVDRISS